MLPVLKVLKMKIFFRSGAVKGIRGREAAG